ncbi:hypothetical protein [Bradyrhizobium elkanii]|jgi:hypothetical protein|uniref:hypothetical protein n=1 Tax=Bradyrhizobium elkanii TaxID=29448 RepID=UPI0027155744|nr:hypothetical protein [Bradyrhizobium elkanii]WLB84511.1 hypothetical protein QIH83_18990 [Bradyrhizobium elkanii]
MRREDIDQDLRNLAFDFFYWFSRFEFALKEKRFLKDNTVGARAEPDWDKFVKAHRGAYGVSPAAHALLVEKPRRQIVGDPDHGFEDVPFSPNTADLDRVVAYAKTVRNNLFHGGKHGHDQWDDPARMRRLLGLTITVLGELAALGDFGGDYDRYY